MIYNNKAYESVAEDYHGLHDKLKHKPEFLFEEAQCLSKTGQHAEAIRVLERAKRLSGDPMIRYMTAKNRQVLGDYRADECQFFTPEQIDQLRTLVDERDMPVICFGLRTDFLTHLFPGSRRLFEVADSLTEIKTVCACGHKATVNARIAGGRIVTEGEQVFLGGNESYVAMCYKCWQEKIKKQREEDNNR